jgi:D-glycerate 3-kinase
LPAAPPDIHELLRAEGLPASYAELVERLHAPLAERLVAALEAKGPPLVVGLTGPQGSGKSTIALVLERLLGARGLRTAILALDDLYLPKAERLRLARDVHPLLAMRGPPGTHEVALGMVVIDALARPVETLVPRFDKASDERLPRRRWRPVQGPCDIILFEGWCVGARPERPAALAAPVNTLEREEDPQGVWRGFVNEALAGPYQALFAPIGWQALLRPPAFEAVLGWRIEQERKLRSRQIEAGAAHIGQSDDELARFVMGYERLTRHIDAEMPARADVVADLGWDRDLIALRLGRRV